jgi:hypothetical protein
MKTAKRALSGAVGARAGLGVNASRATLEWCICWMHTTTMTDEHGKNHDPSARDLGRWQKAAHHKAAAIPNEPTIRTNSPSSSSTWRLAKLCASRD